MRDSVRAAPGPTLTLHKRQGARPLTLTLAGLGTQPPPQPPPPRPKPCPGGKGRRVATPRPSRPARAHLPQPGVPGPRAAAAEVVSKAGPDATRAPRPGGSRGSGGDLGRWRGTAAPRGAGRGAPGSAARRQVRAERGALCGGGAGTAVRAAPARARSATPRLGTRAGSAGRGQSFSRPSIAAGLAPAPGVARPSEPRVDQDPRAAPFQYPPTLSPAWPTLGPSQGSPPPILEGKSCSSKPGASQYQREEGKRSGEVVSGKLATRTPPGDRQVSPQRVRVSACPSTLSPVRMPPAHKCTQVVLKADGLNEDEVTMRVSKILEEWMERGDSSWEKAPRAGMLDRWVG